MKIVVDNTLPLGEGNGGDYKGQVSRNCVCLGKWEFGGWIYEGQFTQGKYGVYRMNGFGRYINSQSYDIGYFKNHLLNG